jgi:photosystem II stability/assembly factor-like uncharacterized protein
MHRLAVLLAVILAVPAAGARRRAVVPSSPETVCTIRGLANLYLSIDSGKTFSHNAEPSALGGTRGPAIFEDDPQWLVIAVSSSVFDSNDGGCSWSLRYTLNESIHHALRTVAGTRGRAYVWTEELALRYDNGVVAPMVLPEQIGALGVDRSNPEHVRIASLIRGQLYDSFDGGATWKAIGSEAGAFVAAAAFDPDQFDHIALGIQNRGLLVTRDAGRKWSATSAPFTPTVYPCQLEFVRNAPNVIWAAVATRESGATVFRSANGGSQFEAVGRLDGFENGVCAPLVAHPHDPNIAIVPSGTLRSFDAVSKTVTESSCCGVLISRITYSPVAANVIYVYGR